MGPAAADLLDQQDRAGAHVGVRDRSAGDGTPRVILDVADNSVVGDDHDLGVLVDADGLEVVEVVRGHEQGAARGDRMLQREDAGVAALPDRLDRRLEELLRAGRQSSPRK